MNMELPNKEFDEIRPYYDSEVSEAIADLVADRQLRPFFINLFPIFKFEKFVKQLKTVKSIYDFQSVFAYPALKYIIKNSIKKLTCDGLEKLDTGENYLLISNHRDIVLDPSLMNFVMFEKGHNTMQTAIGDNLYVSSIVTHFLKLNKSFTVKRNVQPRAFYDYSKTLSAYIRHVVKEKHESVWIAQREGRAKDGNDRTQLGLLKMLMMSIEKSEKETFFDLNVIPVAISYEYDPCDFLKAIELYMADHELPYEKTTDKDLKSMLQGIIDYKGKVHISFGDALKDNSDLSNPELSYNDWVRLVAENIDKFIHTHYHLFKTNLMAYDMLYKTRKFAKKYSINEKVKFTEYLQSRVDMVPEHVDQAEIMTILLTMYSNPVKNQLEYC
jgi:1-acyl-sn-glycerol-3-phosphate acyltransferase